MTRRSPSRLTSVAGPSLRPETLGTTFDDDDAPPNPHIVFPDAQLGEWLVAAFGPVAADHNGFALRLHGCKINDAAIERLEAATYSPKDRVFAEPSLQAASDRMRDPATNGVHMIALAAWAEAGFPRVQLGHRLASSLLATHVPDDVLAEVLPPWPAFQIDLPSGLLHRAADGDDRPVTAVIASHDDGRWAYFALRDGGTAGFRRGMSAEQITRELRPVDLDREAPFPSSLDVDNRVMGLIGRLVVNVCLELSSPVCDVKQVGVGHGDWQRRAKRSSPTPIGPRIYRLCRDVKVDVRPAVADYVRGGGASPTVQTLVRGHWKNQAHGPGLSLRKRIHVEPHWRGPEDAPIALRMHRLVEG